MGMPPAAPGAPFIRGAKGTGGPKSLPYEGRWHGEAVTEGSTPVPAPNGPPEATEPPSKPLQKRPAATIGRRSLTVKAQISSVRGFLPPLGKASPWTMYLETTL